MNDQYDLLCLLALEEEKSNAGQDSDTYADEIVCACKQYLAPRPDPS